ncbi:MAG TPA: A24 family peptidase [Thiolinea sp.]|nr:A24 family peptidase [Thiolinea sp.]
MELLQLLNTSSLSLLITTGLVSLLIGSFLNVVINRLPVMMEREWKQECNELLGHAEPAMSDTHAFNLVLPRSQCPNCGHAITALENIPLISYLVLGGKCRGCKTPISIQYPLVELGTALLSMLVAYQYGFSLTTLALLGLTWTLIALFMIDAKTMLLPDSLTLPLMWAGILVSMQGLTNLPLHDSVIGAVAGYLFLWLIYHAFRLLTGKEGMGHGDFKLLAAIGAWGGWQILPFVIFASSALGAVFGIAWMLIRRQRESLPMPFGPWLALAGFIAVIWRPQVTDFMGRLLFP